MENDPQNSNVEMEQSEQDETELMEQPSEIRRFIIAIRLFIDDHRFLFVRLDNFFSSLLYGGFICAVTFLTAVELRPGHELDDETRQVYSIILLSFALYSLFVLISNLFRASIEPVGEEKEVDNTKTYLESIKRSVDMLKVELKVKVDKKVLDKKVDKLDSKVEQGIKDLDSKVERQISELDSKVENEINGLNSRVDEKIDQEKISAALVNILESIEKIKKNISTN